MRLFLFALALPSFSACTSYRTVSPADLATGGATKAVRVVPSGEPAVVLEWPTVVGDSVVGHVQGVRHAYALEGIAHLERRKLDEGRTAATVAGGLAATVVVTTLLAAAAAFALLASLFTSGAAR